MGQTCQENTMNLEKNAQGSFVPRVAQEFRWSTSSISAEMDSFFGTIRLFAFFLKIYTTVEHSKGLFQSVSKSTIKHKLVLQSSCSKTILPTVLQALNSTANDASS
jgi:hypothetical protein